MILEGVDIEGNPGFGILIVFSGGAKLTGNAISLNNVWLEQNGTPAISGAMDGSQMVPAVSSGGTGTIKGTFNPLSNILTLTVDYTGLSSAATSAQLYNGASGTIGTFIGSLPAFPPSSSPWNGEFQLTNAADINAALNNNLYLTINTVGHPFPSAEIRSQLITNNIIIAGKTFTPSELRWIRLEGVRSVSINASYVNSVELIDSSMSLFNCRSDRSYGTNIVNVDDSSSLVASEHRYGPPVSENIFVNSISYDGSTDIYNDPAIPTSVWGPLRITLMAGLTNVVLSQPMFKGMDVELWNGYDGRPDADAFAVQDAGTTANYVGPSYAPELNIMCREMGLTDQDLVYSTESFTPVAGVYYFWSIHAWLCHAGHKISGWIGSEPDGNFQVLGQVIFKPGQWACSYGLKKFEEGTELRPFHLWFQGGRQFVSTFRFAHYQVLAFSNLSDAVAYMNNKGVAHPGRQCEE